MKKKEFKEILTKRYIGAAVKGGAFPVVAEHCNILQTEFADHTDIIRIILCLDRDSTPSDARIIEKIDLDKNSKSKEYTAEDMAVIFSVIDAIIFHLEDLQ